MGNFQSISLEICVILLIPDNSNSEFQRVEGNEIVNPDLNVNENPNFGYLGKVTLRDFELNFNPLVFFFWTLNTH